MSDDIVVQLQDWAHIVDNSANRAWVVILSGEVFSQASAEIEQLRAEVARLNSLLYPDEMSATEKVEYLHQQIVKTVKGYND